LDVPTLMASTKESVAMKNITIETVYKRIVDLQRDVAQIKRTLLEEPGLREEFILRMRDIDLEKSIIIEDFTKRYSLNNV